METWVKKEVGRKLVHSYLIFLQVLFLVLTQNKFASIILLSSLISFSIFMNFLVKKRNLPFFSGLYEAVISFSRDGKPKTEAVHSIFFLSLGCLFPLLLFSVEKAIIAIIVFGVSDPLAAIVGRFGKVNLANGKTLEGSIAFLISCIFVLKFFNIEFFLLPAFAITLTEVLTPVNDNLVIPVVSGFFL